MALNKSKNRGRPGRIKLYADKNVGMALIRYLRSAHKVKITTAVEMGFHGRDDKFHFQQAKKQGRFLLTCDKDFLNHSKFPFNQMVGVVVLDVPPEFPGLGWMSVLLEEHIVPSGKEIYGTKILLRAGICEIYSVDESGKVQKQVLALTS